MSAPAVAASADGKRLAAAWMDQRSRGGELDVYWALTQGGAFRSDERLQADGRGAQNHPALAADASGVVWAAWEDMPDKSRGQRQSIAVRSSAGGEAGKERRLSEEPEGKASYPSIAGAGGIVAVVYEAEKEGETSVVFRRVK
ncbi:MAG: hypothetical protein HY721_34715 [Planctomycetes bacterium]|nr:hypothetical protein [Planctomycetota bacterium]